MARLRGVAAAVLLAGGLTLAMPVAAHADDRPPQGGGSDCILCWPGWG